MSEIRVRVIIFSYQREEMLTKILLHLRGKVSSILVLDDCSSYPEIKMEGIEYRRAKERRGKRNFYLQWDEAFDYCKENPSDIFIFMPDDFLNIDIESILKIDQSLIQSSKQNYAFNIINDGRVQMWTPIFRSPKQFGRIPGFSVGFVDCGFFCNEGTLKQLMYCIDQVPEEWFDNPHKSSGVGMQLSKRMVKAQIKMYQPLKSLAYHGDHDSVMHPEHRKQVPLKSR